MPSTKTRSARIAHPAMSANETSCGVSTGACSAAGAATARELRRGWKRLPAADDLVEHHRHAPEIASVIGLAGGPCLLGAHERRCPEEHTRSSSSRTRSRSRSATFSTRRECSVRGGTERIGQRRTHALLDARRLDHRPIGLVERFATVATSSTHHQWCSARP